MPWLAPVEPAGAESDDIPQQDGADPDPDNVCDPHSGYVFNAVICKNETEECQYRGKEIIPGYESSDLDKINDYCMKVCKNLNSAYGHIEESLHEKFKDTKICKNFRKWRRCPQHFHLPTDNCILKYMIVR